VARVRFFAQAKDAAGRPSDVLDGATVGDVLDGAVVRYGQVLADVISFSTVWLNGEPADRSTPLGDDDEVAVLPPVSGG
jgi:molybdopterin synthase sulfur carrier subunit